MKKYNLVLKRKGHILYDLSIEHDPKATYSDLWIGDVNILLEGVERVETRRLSGPWDLNITSEGKLITQFKSDDIKQIKARIEDVFPFE